MSYKKRARALMKSLPPIMESDKPLSDEDKDTVRLFTELWKVWVDFALMEDDDDITDAEYSIAEARYVEMKNYVDRICLERYGNSEQGEVMA